MSDRRPPKPGLRAVMGPGRCGDLDCLVHAPTHEATPADLVAELRGWVESGTIKGAELDALIGEVGLRLLRYERSGGTLTIERVQTTILNVFDGHLVIPVSDGGSET